SQRLTDWATQAPPKLFFYIVSLYSPFFHKNKNLSLVANKKNWLGAPGWLSRLSLRLRLRSDLTFVGSSPASGSVLTASSEPGACFWFCVSFSLCPSPSHALSLSVLKINETLKKKELACFCLIAGLWRSCSQYTQVASNEDLPIPMENPYKEPLKKCILCGKRVDYKNVQLLSQFISPFTGCIYGRHITGLCGKKQKEITKAIKRAQILGFMPVIYKDPAYLKDPKVCNIKYRE
uniref:Small ribosomal subunit protein bS18m n=1 Tax=Suricata suricatta TaxID=37032 RepID=A0A673U8R3_SURSU